MIVKENLKVSVNQPRHIAKIIKEIIDGYDEIDQQKEHFYVVGLNTKNHIIYIDLVTLGILDSSLIHPRETFRLAILKGVKSIIICHNHPSGNTLPSLQDDEIYKRLKQSGEILGIELLDSIILGDNSFYSYGIGSEESFLERKV